MNDMNLNVTEKLCDLCKHRHPDSHPPSCTAFPDASPWQSVGWNSITVSHTRAITGFALSRWTIPLRPRSRWPTSSGERTPPPVRRANCKTGWPQSWSLFRFRLERQFLGLVVQQTAQFEELPEEARQLILAGEQAQKQSGNHGKPPRKPRRSP